MTHFLTSSPTYRNKIQIDHIIVYLVVQFTIYTTVKKIMKQDTRSCCISLTPFILLRHLVTQDKNRSNHSTRCICSFAESEMDFNMKSEINGRYHRTNSFTMQPTTTSGDTDNQHMPIIALDYGSNKIRLSDNRRRRRRRR